MQKITIINISGEVVFQVVIADRWIKRLFGLLLQRELSYEQSLWLRPCRSIHTIGMHYPIDVIFINRFSYVVRTVSCLPPFRLSRAPSSTHSVIELRAGSIEQFGIHIGSKVVQDSL